MSLTNNLQGTSVGVYAVLTPGPQLRVPYPWECHIDDMTIPPAVIQKRATATILKICSQDGLSAELSHNITLGPVIDLNNPVPQVEVYFDYIEYLPSPANNPKLYPYLGVSADDPAVEYNQGSFPLTAVDGTPASEILYTTSFISYIFNGEHIEGFCSRSERKLKSL